jgi:hypothetical protein
MSYHAMLSPSGAHRWMTCPGSVRMEQGEPNIGNEYSDEGTAAHWLAAHCLTDNVHPVAFIGRVISVVNGVAEPGEPPQPEDTVREFEVDAEFAEHVNTYVQHIREYAAGATLCVEQELPIGHITGEDGATGTGDAVVIRTDDRELQLHDLKFGKGVSVAAERNRQLLLYALGAVRAFQDAGPFDTLRLVIHQPRLGQLSEWSCSMEELQSFAVLAGERAYHALQVLANEKPEAIIHHLKPSEDACKFCKAKAKCPALGKFVTDNIGADFEAISKDDVAAAGALDDLKTLGTKLTAVDLIESWCKAVRAKVEATLFEHSNAHEAIDALGFKLVQGKKGARQWQDTAEAEALLKKMRFKVEEMYSMTVITPPAAEKLMKDEPKRWARVLPLITQRDGKPSVAPKNDKRPPLEITPAADDFVALDGSDLV